MKTKDLYLCELGKVTDQVPVSALWTRTSFIEHTGVFCICKGHSDKYIDVFTRTTYTSNNAFVQPGGYYISTAAPFITNKNRISLQDLSMILAEKNNVYIEPKGRQKTKRFANPKE